MPASSYSLFKRSYAGSDQCSLWSSVWYSLQKKLQGAMTHYNSRYSRELNLLNLDSASLWQRLFTEDKNMCVCVSAFVSVQICVFL